MSRKKSQEPDLSQPLASIVIRHATPKDVPAIVSLLHASFAEFEPHFPPDGLAAARRVIDDFGGRWDDGPVWVARESHAIVGTVSARPDGDSLYVRSMAVLPSVQGRGVGRLLLDRVDAYARDKGFKRLYLSTTPFFVRAIRLYESSGYRRVGDQSEHYGAPLITMEKLLVSVGS